MAGEDIASVLHRETIAVIVGNRTFERGEQCFAAGRVLEVAATRGELRGTIRPAESGRAPYRVRIWVRAEGMAYQCTCPIGSDRQFCKHGVALALAHLDRVKPPADDLRARLLAMKPAALVDRLLERAARDPALLEALRGLA
jgi:uncharacterized Zn finger protein